MTDASGMGERLSTAVRGIVFSSKASLARAFQPVGRLLPGDNLERSPLLNTEHRTLDTTSPLARNHDGARQAPAQRS